MGLGGLFNVFLLLDADCWIGSLDAILTRAVQHCPQAEVLWLMVAEEKRFAGDVHDGCSNLRL